MRAGSGDQAVEAEVVDLELAQRQVGHAGVDLVERSTVAKSRTRRSRRPATRGVPRARRAISCAPSWLTGTPMQAGAAQDDVLELRHGVELEARDDAEAVAQRLGEQAGAGRGAHQRERRQVEPDRARGRAVADHQVELEVLHRGIEDLLDGHLQAVDLVDEQDVARLEVGQDRGEVAGLRDHRAGGHPEADAKLGRHDLGERRLAQARRPANSTWSSASPRVRAASMNTWRFARSWAWPTKSTSRRGRRVVSWSSGEVSGAMSREASSVKRRAP
jgi:hypothetical protein